MRIWVVALSIFGWMSFGDVYRARAAVTYTYTGSVYAASYHNGEMGFGQWLIYGPNPDLGDNDDNTGVYYPFTPNWYGGPVAGSLGVRPIDDGRIPYDAAITLVEMVARVRGGLPLGNRLQTFVHRHDSGWPGDHDVWGDLSWRSYPLSQWPTSPPFVFGWYWQQDQWTDITAIFYHNGIGLPWTREGIFQHCFGLWVSVPLGGGLRWSEWSLRITTGER